MGSREIGSANLVETCQDPVTDQRPGLSCVQDWADLSRQILLMIITINGREQPGGNYGAGAQGGTAHMKDENAVVLT